MDLGPINLDGESPLDELIPASDRARIDGRKERVGVFADRNDLSGFKGSASVDLSFRDSAVKQQFKARKCAGFRTFVGTCSTFGLVAAMENVLGGATDLSESHMWNQYCVPSSASAIKSITTGKGIVEQDRYSGDYSKATRYKVDQYRDLEDNVLAMLEALDQGSPLYLAINTPSVMYSRRKHIPANSGHTSGGHAVAIVGYQLDPTLESGVYLLIKNSWGTSNLNDPDPEKRFNGYQWLDAGYCARKGNYCHVWAIDQVASLESSAF